jgi:taurine dioxygenase
LTSLETVTGTHRIERLHPTFGAVLHGIDASRPLSDDERQLVLDTFLEHKVVALPDQHLDAGSLRRFALQFGDEWPHPILDDYPDHGWVRQQEIGFQDRADTWHSDGTFVEDPPFGTVLEVTEIPEMGGDTLFVDLQAAYEGLSPAVRDLFDTLEVVHDGSNFVTYAFGPSLPEQRRVEMFQAAMRKVVHPLVHVHPETGRRGLYGTPGFARSIKDVTFEENAAILSLVNAHINRTEYILRYRWSVGDVVLWDNRCVLHRVSDDYGDARRRFLRVQLEHRRTP